MLINRGIVRELISEFSTVKHCESAKMSFVDRSETGTNKCDDRFAISKEFYVVK